jgi:hypothetical protein
MIAQGWGVAAGKAGNTEWQAVTVDVKKGLEYACKGE